MKKNILFSLLITVVGLFPTPAQAIDMTKYAVSYTDVLTTIASKTSEDFTNPQYVYLYNVEEGKFLNAGDNYGVSMMFHLVGMKFLITENIFNSSGGYFIFSSVYNRTVGRCLSINAPNTSVAGEIDLDRTVGLSSASVSKETAITGRTLSFYEYVDGVKKDQNYDYSRWEFELVEGKEKQYYIKNKGSLGGYIYLGTTVKPTKTPSSSWMILTEESYQKMIVDLGGTEEINLSCLIFDNFFGLMNRYESQWKSLTGNHLISYVPQETYAPASWNTSGIDRDTYQRYSGKYTCAEIDNETNTMYQQLTGLKAGRYRVECRGFFRNKSNTSAPSNSYLFVSGSNSWEAELATSATKTLLQTYNEAHTGILQTGASTKTAYTFDAYRTATGQTQTRLPDNCIAASILANNPNSYNSAVEIYLQSGQTLTLGLYKSASDGEAFIDDVMLYYLGPNELVIDEDCADAEHLNKMKYTDPVRLDLRRTFTKEKWNALVLPISLSGSQVKELLGNNVKLSKLRGINPAQPLQIVFDPIDLNTSGLEAGQCYVVWVDKDPDVADGVEYTYERGLATETITGPLYQIDGVTRTEAVTEDSEENPLNPAYTVETAAGKLKFTGFYWQTDGGAEPQSYIVTKGKMYHLATAHKMYGTYWALNDVENGSQTLSVAFDGISDQLTGIDAIETLPNPNSTASVPSSQRVYTLDGRKVASGATLPKGIYLMNGRKTVVK